MAGLALGEEELGRLAGQAADESSIGQRIKNAIGIGEAADEGSQLSRTDFSRLVNRGGQGGVKLPGGVNIELQPIESGAGDGAPIEVNPGASEEEELIPKSSENGIRQRTPSQRGIEGDLKDVPLNEEEQPLIPGNTPGRLPKIPSASTIGKTAAGAGVASGIAAGATAAATDDSDDTPETPQTPKRPRPGNDDPTVSPDEPGTKKPKPSPGDGGDNSGGGGESGAGGDDSKTVPAQATTVSVAPPEPQTGKVHYNGRKFSYNPYYFDNNQLPLVRKAVASYALRMHTLQELRGDF